MIFGKDNAETDKTPRNRSWGSSITYCIILNWLNFVGTVCNAGLRRANPPDAATGIVA
jgi:hypothetical protein